MKLRWLVFFVGAFVVLCAGSALYGQANSQLVEDVKAGNLQGVKEAIEAGASANGVGGRYRESLLNLAADNGHLATVGYLIQEGAEINKVTGVYGGMTPLIRASSGCHTEIIQLLIEKGADPNLTNDGSHCTSPLYVAATSGCLEGAKYLLAHGANIDFATGGKEEPGHTVLTGAIVTSLDGEVAVMLAEAGANVNQAAYGKYPIQYAIEEFPIISNYAPTRDNPKADGFVKLIRTLLERGASPQAKTPKGETLTELAQMKFGRVLEPSSVELTLKKQEAQHLGGEVKSGKPNAQKDEMVQFYKQKHQEILKLIHEYESKPTEKGGLSQPKPDAI